MRRHPTTWGAALALLVLTTACGDEDRTQTDYTASLDKTSTSSDDTAATPARAAPGVEDTVPPPAHLPRSASVALRPLGHDSVQGTARAASVGSATSIEATLAHGTSGASYAGAVREGACTRPGTTIASLIPATADSLGRARSVSDVPVPLDSLLGKPHVLVFGVGGHAQVCGSLSGGGPTPADSAPPGPPSAP